jgi:hypothetical protein
MAKEVMQFTLAHDMAGVGRAGQLIEMALTPADVHEPTELPTYLAGYRNAKYRADEVSFPVLVDKDNDKRRDFSSDDAFRRVDVKAAIMSAPPEVDPKSSLTEYKVIDRFVGAFISDITEGQAPPLYKPRQRAMRRCANAILLDRELDVWTLLSTAGSWAATNRLALAAAQKWNGGATSNPILDLQYIIEQSAQTVTDIFFNQRVANAFLRHALVRDHMRQMLGDRGVDSALAAVNQAKAEQSVDFAIPGLPPFHVVGSKIKNETTLALDYVLGDSFCVLACNPVGVPQDGEEIATSITFRRRGIAGVGYETREFRVEDRGPKGGTMVVVSQADIAQVTSNISGGLISGCIV